MADSASFSLLIKPASADCNCACTYCFYLDRAALYPHTISHRMNDEVLERLIASFMATAQPQYAFGWQGGEPTLMGLAFFERVVELQKRYGVQGSSVANGLQTNGLRIDQPFARHLARYRFLTGVSLDGPAEIHNRYRTLAGGGESHQGVMRGIRHLRECGAEFNILTLVSQANVSRAREVYRYLGEHGFMHQQYIPCDEVDEQGRRLPFAISGEQWGDFLCELFDQWYAGDTRRVSIRLFDAILSRLVDNQYAVCHMDRQCSHYFVVEYNGDVYPCDFFVEADLRLGSIMDSSWDSLRHSRIYREFSNRKKAWAAACESCPYAPFCHGDCPKNRRGMYAGDPRTLSRLCAGWKQFYGHALPAFKKLAEKIRSERSRLEAARAGAPPSPPGRNDPCPCGSGKKYKHCCGKK